MIVLSYKDFHDSRILEDIDLPVFYQFDNELITVITQETRKNLERNNIKYQVIDETPWSHDYFLLTARPGHKVIIDPSWGKLLWKKNSVALLKTASLPIEQLIQNNLQFASFPNTPRYIKNEKYIPYNNTVYLSQDEISQVLAEIDPDSVRFFIQGLQDLGTRYYQASNRDAVAEWIRDQFIRIGITDVAVDSFFFANTWQKNVIATLTGKSMPDKTIVLGGHHDSITYDNPMVFAPGTDDNASGTAAVMEIARAIIASQYQSDYTLKFVTFAAEEAGLHGSFDFAQKTVNAGLEIQLMLNHDMISYTTGTPGNWEIDLEYYSGYEYLVPLASQLILNYTTLIPVQGFLNSSGSDSYAFWVNGYPAIYYFEHEFSPFYHSAGDILENYNMGYCAEVVKASAALLVQTVETPAIVKNYNLLDRGDGESLLLTWAPNDEPDLEGYHVYLGKSTGNYDTSYISMDTTFILGQIAEGVEYFVGLAAYDSEGKEGMVVERSGTPLSIPMPPSNIADSPDPDKIMLSWSPNLENDLLGYNIYRSDQSGQTGNKINIMVVKDTSYQDIAAPSGKFLYYSVKAVDSLLNESVDNSQIKSRIVSLDGGILIVDETADGDGSLYRPTDSEVDAFYRDFCDGFAWEEYDFIDEGSIKLANLGGYSSVIWHGNDFTVQYIEESVKESIQQYLEFGGNLLITSFLPSMTFASNSYYPTQFSEGDFIYDFLKIAEVDFKPTARFIGAQPDGGNYSTINVDTTKSAASTAYHLVKIESLVPSPEAQVIFNYQTDYDPGTPFGYLSGKPVGIEYLGSDYRLIVLSFPLYYMNYVEAQSFVTKVLTEKYDEALPIVSSSKEIPTNFELRQNYPNPFNPHTYIEFAISEPAHTRIELFNILGQRIAILMDEAKPAGYYTIDFESGNLPGGVYFYRLTAESLTGNSRNFQKTNKMLLLK